MAQRLLLVALCAVIAVQLISSVDGARKHGCIARCNTGCRKKHTNNVMQCLKACWQTYPRSCQKCKKNDDRCYGCLPGFMLSNAKCIPCATGCICDQTSTCLDCRAGYVKTPNGCAVCNPGCVCDSTGACTCKSGYVASATYDPTKPTTTGPQCLACPANCADCSSTGPAECFTCKAGYTLIDNVCQACMSGCLDCSSGLTTCVTCKPGYRTDVGATSTTCTACPANCATCDIFNATYCDTCNEGYGLTRNRKGCLPCAPNCKKCNLNGYNSCDGDGCKPGYQFSSGACSTPCALTNCERCQTDPTNGCDRCMAGTTWSATAKKCLGTGCTSDLVGCIECDPSDGTHCKTCAYGYGYDSGAFTCVGCDDTFGICKSCTVVNSNPVCSRCPDGYVKNTAWAASGDTVCWPCDTGCKDCTAANFDAATGECKTLSCSDNSSPTGGPPAVCTTACDPNCAAPYCPLQTAAGTNGKCDLNCVEGYVLRLSDHSCQACGSASPSNCNHCLTAGAGSCDGPSYCEDNYSLTADNKCIKNAA